MKSWSVAWLMLYLIATSLALVLMTFRAWWRVFVIGLSLMWMWVIDVVTLFLMLASNMMSAIEGDSNDLIAILSSSWTQEVTLQFTCLLKSWKRKQLENVFIILWPGNSSGLIKSNEEKTLLKWLSMSTKWPLIRLYCLFVKKLSKRGCWWRGNLLHELIREQRIWLEGSEYTLSCNLPSIFCRWRLIGVRLAMASIPINGAVLKLPTIHEATLLCILFIIFIGYKRGALL